VRLQGQLAREGEGRLLRRGKPRPVTVQRGNLFLLASSGAQLPLLMAQAVLAVVRPRDDPEQLRLEGIVERAAGVLFATEPPLRLGLCSPACTARAAALVTAAALAELRLLFLGQFRQGCGLQPSCPPGTASSPVALAAAAGLLDRRRRTRRPPRQDEHCSCELTHRDTLLSCDSNCRGRCGRRSAPGWCRPRRPCLRTVLPLGSQRQRDGKAASTPGAPGAIW
jgi:hypothetical protein